MVVRLTGISLKEELVVLYKPQTSSMRYFPWIMLKNPTGPTWNPNIDKEQPTCLWECYQNAQKNCRTASLNWNDRLSSISELLMAIRRDLRKVFHETLRNYKKLKYDCLVIEDTKYGGP